ncbi:MAG: MATE family efflux transporter [Lachnospiraceae bacterium]|nr:MATE family efflux transporter [Lachnospiraceae bacterium]
MAKSATKDMTVGSPMKLILEFAIPTLLGLLFQQLYSMVDTIIVGKWLGVNSLAAVGSTGSLNFMVVGFCIGVCSGFAIPVAQKFGAGDYRALRRFVANGVWIAAIFSVIMTTLVSYFCMDILKVMKTPDNIIQEAYLYIVVIFLGIPVTYLYNLLSGVIRSLGDSKTPVYFLVLSSVLNIGLDLLSIGVLHMGVTGPALATVISQAVSGILCLLYIKKHYEILHIQKDEWAWDWHYVKILCGMGIPMGLQYSITAIGSVVLQTAVNSLGSMAVASVTAAGKVSMFFCCPFDALGGTMATYAGQNVGAKKLGRISQGLRSASILGAIYGIAACLVLSFFGKTIALLFMDANEVEILNSAQLFLRINTAFYIPLALVNIVRFAIQGMGFSTFAILSGVCEMIARAVVAFAFVPMFGFVAVCTANPLAWIMADLFLIPAYFYCLRKLRGWFEKPKRI